MLDEHLIQVGIISFFGIVTIVRLWTIEENIKKLKGDAQQIKTAQRADKKRDYKIMRKVGRPRKNIYS